MVKWIITKYQHEWIHNRLLVLVWTDQPIHCFLHYSLSEEIFSETGSDRRGIRRLLKPLWELANPIIIEQENPGDTLYHQFFIPAVPDQATLTFFLTAEQEGVRTKSVAVPIKIQHPKQNGANPIDPSPFAEYVDFSPWRSNFKDAVGIHDDIWNTTGMTGTGYFAYGMNQLSLIIGPTPGSIAEIYAGDIFALGFDHTLRSQLRAVVRFPVVDNDLLAHMIHGSIASNSGYGFQTFQGELRGFLRQTAASYNFILDISLVADTTYLIEAKYLPGERVEWWVNGEYIRHYHLFLPDSSGHSFHARVENPSTGSSAIHFRRFMIWQESIWTGAYHE